ncbi:MAG: hypothetical protein M9897_04785 [Brumimicrobium sp.]|nr:hypothetical protein [Brumimicrobium sp.]
MKTLNKYLWVAGSLLTLSGCANYGYISENDVYLQKPTEIVLNQDETDLTSFNSFMARQRGHYQDEYVDPRFTNKARAMHYSYGLMAGPYWYSVRPIGFVGVGQTPWDYGFDAWAYGGSNYWLYAYQNSMWGPYGYYNRYNYYDMWGMYPYSSYPAYYYGNSYYPYYPNYGFSSPNNTSTNNGYYNGPRTSVSSSSHRSSSYPQTQQPGMNPYQTSKVNSSSSSAPEASRGTREKYNASTATRTTQTVASNPRYIPSNSFERSNPSSTRVSSEATRGNDTRYNSRNTTSTREINQSRMSSGYSNEGMGVSRESSGNRNYGTSGSGSSNSSYPGRR